MFLFFLFHFLTSTFPILQLIYLSSIYSPKISLHLSTTFNIPSTFLQPQSPTILKFYMLYPLVHLISPLYQQTCVLFWQGSINGYDTFNSDAVFLCLAESFSLRLSNSRFFLNFTLIHLGQFHRFSMSKHSSICMFFCKTPIRFKTVQFNFKFKNIN